MWMPLYSIRSSPQRKTSEGYIQLDKVSRLSIKALGDTGVGPYSGKFGIVVHADKMPAGVYAGFFNTREEADEALKSFTDKAGYTTFNSTVEEEN